ncbi:hypothetical protein P8452_03433 [Trifolium repens]|nr:hypothetical protein P8452_03433 [Trifolium repens]
MRSILERKLYPNQAEHWISLLNPGNLIPFFSFPNLLLTLHSSPISDFLQFPRQFSLFSNTLFFTLNPPPSSFISLSSIINPSYYSLFSRSLEVKVRFPLMRTNSIHEFDGGLMWFL